MIKYSDSKGKVRLEKTKRRGDERFGEDSNLEDSRKGSNWIGNTGFSDEEELESADWTPIAGQKGEKKRNNKGRGFY